jgi:hypothetical protein
MENSKTILDQMIGYDVTWFDYSSTDKQGRVFQREIAVLPICAIKPCDQCWRCTLAKMRRAHRG